MDVISVFCFYRMYKEQSGAYKVVNPHADWVPARRLDFLTYFLVGVVFSQPYKYGLLGWSHLLVGWVVSICFTMGRTASEYGMQLDRAAIRNLGPPAPPNFTRFSHRFYSVPSCNSVKERVDQRRV